MDLGVLLSLPVESVAVRAVVAALACVVALRVLLRVGIRTPGVRVLSALAPAIAIVAVVVITTSQTVLSRSHLQLPTLMLPVEGRGALPIPVADGYLHFAPMAVPLLLGLWGLLAGGRLLRRGLASRAIRQRARRSVGVSHTPARVREVARRVATMLRVPMPMVAVVPSCPGGAYVVGGRRPVLVLDRTLIGRLDGDELEGVIAHELAHVRRRDNLVAVLLGVVRDVAFFVPGVRWAIRRLHRERELAADQVAVHATGRPGALASGLLKVLEHGHAPGRAHPCAALVPAGGVVDRVRILLEAAPAASRRRSLGELATVSGVVAVAVVATVLITSAFTGAERQRDALALMWSNGGPTLDAAAVTAAEARAFDVYRRSSLATSRGSGDLLILPLLAPHDERAVENQRGVLRACGTEGADCPVPSRTMSLGLRPTPVITIDTAVTSSWQATPVVDQGSPVRSFGVYWLSRVG